MVATQEKALETREKEQDFDTNPQVSSSESTTSESSSELSDRDEDDIANVGSEGNNTDNTIPISAQLRLDRANSIKKRPFEQKGTTRYLALVLGLLVIGGLVKKAWQIIQPKPDYAKREIPSTAKKVDYSKPPTIDYQAKYALSDQKIELEKFETDKVKQNSTLPNLPPQTLKASKDKVVIQDKPARVIAKVTPLDLYKRATSMGTYGKVIASNTNVDRVKANSLTKEIVPNYSTQIKNYDKILPLGSKTTGVLRDTISSLDKDSLINRNFIIEVSFSLKSPNGETILPAGSKLIVKVDRIHPNGYIKLIPIQLQMISLSTSDLVREIAPHQIDINAHNGELLKAKVIKPDTLPQEMLAAIFSGASDAAQLINRPRSTFYSSYEGGFSRSLDNGEGNMGAAAIGGFSRSMSRRMERSAELEKQRLNRLDSVFLLKAGTKVEIYINSDFKL